MPSSSLKIQERSQSLLFFAFFNNWKEEVSVKLAYKKMKRSLATLENTISLFAEEETVVIPKPNKKRKVKTQATLNIPPVNISHQIVAEQEILFNFNGDILEDVEDNYLESEEQDPLSEDDEYGELTSDEVEEVSEEEQEKYFSAVGLGEFFQSIQHIKVLTRDEEREMFEAYRANETNELRNQIICHNIKLVVSVAKKIRSKNQQLRHKVTLGDMISEGIFGLYEAINKFDLDKKYKFSTYAYYWIYQAITRAIANKADVIRIPVHYGDNMTLIRRLENEYMIQHQVEVVPDEAIIEMMMELRKKRNKKNKKETKDQNNITPEKIKRFRQTTQAVQSLDVEIDESNTTMMEMISDDNGVNPEQICLEKARREDLFAVIRTLTKKEQFIIINRYNLDYREKPMTLDQLAKKFKLTKERIRQIETSALEKLRHPSRSRVIRDYYHTSA